MTERKKDMLALATLLALLILLFAKILFTAKIIRAPDIINESYWGVIATKRGSFWDIFDFSQVKAGWNIFINSGFTSEGGNSPVHFLFHLKLIYFLIPAPACVAWLIVLHLFLGGAGVYCYCRAIGVSRIASLLGGLVFAIAPENASLINAGHVMKVCTIAYAPWVFYFFEKGFQSRRVFFFLTTGLVLAIQFFHSHWQIAYYTCLGVGVYGAVRLAGIMLQETREQKRGWGRLLGLNLVTMFFFLSTVSIALIPLANWSKDTNRGVQSGANQGKGGLDRDEAMSWSLPPEELAGFVIPGFFGFSRQEAGENPPNIRSYYWGRMVFTQTVSYMGLLPWLLAPLPLIFRRDRYFWLAVAAVAGGVLFSMGKYTPVYNLLFDYFPGIDRFRVPKMIMFIPVLGLGVLAARGLDILLDEEARRDRRFKAYLYGLIGVPALLVVLLGVELAGKGYWLTAFAEQFWQPTRYEQGAQLVMQRWNNLVRETGIAIGVAALCTGAIVAFSRKRLSVKVIPLVLIGLYLVDVGRVNAKFTFLVDTPQKVVEAKPPVMEFLAKESKEFRVLPMDGTDPMKYVSYEIPVMFTSNPVQQRRWQELLDNFSLTSAIPDMLNVKYLVYTPAQYAQERVQLGERFQPVYQSPDGSQIVLGNRTVLPKSWLVPAVITTTSTAEALGLLQSPYFNPRKAAVVESSPPLPMADPNSAAPLPLQNSSVSTYAEDHIVVSATTPQNALLVLGEKYYAGWLATVDGKSAKVYPVNHVLRGVYLPPGEHKVEFIFDPLSFRVGKSLFFASMVIFIVMAVREMRWRRSGRNGSPAGAAS
jgi:membrane protein YfhO